MNLDDFYSEISDLAGEVEPDDMEQIKVVARRDGTTEHYEVRSIDTRDEDDQQYLVLILEEEGS